MQKRMGVLRFGAVLAIMVLITLTSSCEKCEDYTEVGPVLIEMMSRPESFTSYVTNNNEKFESRFYDCIDKNLGRVRAELKKILDFCDEAHSDPTFRFRCEEDPPEEIASRGASTLEFAEALLEILKVATQNASAATNALDELQFIKQVYENERILLEQQYGFAVPTWEQLFNSTIALSRDAYKCEFCSGGILGIF